MHKIALLRQGKSTWNQEIRFTDRAGWTDAGLAEKGLAEAFAAGQQLKKEGFAVGIAPTSVLRRAIKALWMVPGGNGPDVDSGAALVAAQRTPLCRPSRRPVSAH